MTPPLAFNNLDDGSVANTELSRYLPEGHCCRGSQVPYHTYLRLSEFGLGAKYAWPRMRQNGAALGDHVVVAFIISLALVALICVLGAEFALFFHPSGGSFWFLIEAVLVNTFSVLAFIAFLPAAIVPPSSRAAALCVSSAMFIAPLIEFAEVFARSTVVDPIHTVPSEYWVRITHLVLPAIVAVLVGVALRPVFRRGG